MQGTSPKTGPWLFPVLAAFLLAALFGLHRINDADLGFHLTAGTWILDHHAVPRTDTSTYTVPDHPYVDLEWLYQVLLVLGFKLGGYSLLSLSHIVLSLLAFYILWRRLEEQGTPAASLLFCGAVLACEARFRVRPEVPAWLLLGLTLLILEQRAARAKDHLAWLPVLQLLWVNSEGLFFLGFAAMTFFFFSSRIHGGRWDGKLAKMSLVALALSLLNPYFLDGLLFPFHFLGSLGSSGIYRWAVQEFQNPWTFTPAPGADFPLSIRVYQAFTLVLFTAMALTARRRRFHEWALALFFFALSVAALRNIPLFLLACAPIAARAIGEWPWRTWLPFLRRKTWDHGVPALLALFLLGTGWSVVTNRHWVALKVTDRFGLGLDEDALPEGACRFLNDHHLDGRVINDLDSGDWLSWRWGGKTFLDGRLDVMGPDLFQVYTRSQAPGGASALASELQPDLFCFQPLIIPAWAAELPHLGWRLVYLDPVSVIFLRKGYHDEVRSLGPWDPVNERGLDPTLGLRARAILERTPPGPAMADLFHPSDYPNELLSLGILSGLCGLTRESEVFFLEGIDRTHGKYWDFFYNLGLLYDFEGRNDLATLCMERVKPVLPKDPALRKILGLPPEP
ncbi:MAG TPA: hypothetical protein VHE12_00095 [bacterium]|nr:hypothetical protein [bacterium]